MHICRKCGKIPTKTRGFALFCAWFLESECCFQKGALWDCRTKKKLDPLCRYLHSHPRNVLVFCLALVSRSIGQQVFFLRLVWVGFGALPQSTKPAQYGPNNQSKQSPHEKSCYIPSRFRETLSRTRPMPTLKQHNPYPSVALPEANK